MSLFDSVGRLFGIGAAPAFTVPPGMDPTAAMMQAEARRFEASNAPPPSPDMLKAVLAKATRVRIIEGGMFQGKALGTDVRLDTIDPDDVQGLRDRLRIEAEPGGHCSCLGGHAMELYAGSKLTAVFGLHHGSGLRWEAWKQDAKISGADVFVSWLQHHGIPEPFEELRKSRHAQRITMAAASKWEAGAPAVLKPLLADASKGTLGTTELLLAMDASGDDETTKARQLMKWFGCTGGPWKGAPAYQEVPEAMLVKFRWQTLVEALMTDDGEIKAEPMVLEGAARLFSGEPFLKQRGADLARFSKELKDTLLRHARGTGEKAKFDLMEAAIKRAAQAPAPAAKAGVEEKPPSDNDDLL
ncbi:MAG: hypothetical protein FD180_2145 [Planctomycetota bacterium]|nr:MAG: hypothetical protein FD180_2145 [Planctomycetota bacterium]